MKLKLSASGVAMLGGKATARVQRRRLEVKTIEVETRMATYGWFVLLTDHQQQATHNGANCGRRATHKQHTHIKTPETQLMI